MKKATAAAVAKQVVKETVASNGHIEVSMGTILEMRECLIYLAGKPLPARVSFRLAQLSNTLNPHLAAFNETKDKRIKEIGESIEGTPNFKVKEENMEQFKEEMQVLISEMISLPAFKILLPADFEVEARYLMPLEPFLEVADGGD